MNQNISFSHDVVKAIQNDRKIQAIKLLREANDISLKEAKHAVEKYMEDNPYLITNRKTNNGLGSGALLLIITIIVAFYVINSLYGRS